MTWVDIDYSKRYAKVVGRQDETSKTLENGGAECLIMQHIG